MATDIARGSALVTLARGWIGTPYVHQASLKGVGCDCLGLLRGVWREINGLTQDPEALPPYSPDWAESCGQEILYLGLSRYLKLTAPADMGNGTVLLFRMNGLCPAKHCGILADAGGRRTLIHARMNKQVSEEPFDSYWLRRLAFCFEVP